MTTVIEKAPISHRSRPSVSAARRWPAYGPHGPDHGFRPARSRTRAEGPGVDDPDYQRDALIRQVRPVALDRGPAPGAPVDVRVRRGRIAEIGSGLPARGEPVYDGGGRWIMPCLWDQHVHLTQWVLGALRLDTSGARDAEHACALVARAVAGLPPGTTLQGWGHRSAAWPRPATVAALDEVSDGHPVVLISGDAHHAWLNSAALALLDLPPRGPAGQGGPEVVAEAEWFAVFGRLAELPGVAAAVQERYAEVAAAASARGGVGAVDREFANGPAQWPARFRGEAGPAVDVLRIRAAVYPADLDGALGAGLRTGEPLAGCGGLVTMGPLKIISDGSLNTRTAYCCEPFADAEPGDPPYGVQNLPPRELAELMGRARRGGLDVAVHAIGDRAVADALDAFATTGAGGTIEHAQLMRWADIGRMAGLGLTASVQPAHLWDDRDVTGRCWPDRTDRCFPFRALADAGVPLALGSDAPVAPLDTWLAIAAAVHRSGDDRPAWHPELALRTREALAASTDGVRLAPGHPGDLILLAADPLAVPEDSAEASAALRATEVVATFVAGRCVYAG